MKKIYVAPELVFESFVLSHSVASGCSEQGKGIVEEYNSDWGYFDTLNPSSELSPCAEDWDDSIFEGYCYWQGSIKLFLS